MPQFYFRSWTNISLLVSLWGLHLLFFSSLQHIQPKQDSLVMRIIRQSKQQRTKLLHVIWSIPHINFPVNMWQQDLEDLIFSYRQKHTAAHLHSLTVVKYCNFKFGLCYRGTTMSNKYFNSIKIACFYFLVKSRKASLSHVSKTFDLISSCLSFCKAI